MTATVEHQESKWTPEQRDAIERRGVSVSLSAGAGCGKTAVLTERFLAHFDPRDPLALQPEDLHRLIAITFTERAAREMRDRVRRKCQDRLRDADEKDAPYWAGLVRALDSARISTIHSFCAALVRAHAVEAGVDPQFEVLEQAQSESRLAEVIDDELRRLIAQRDAATLDLAARFDLRGLAEMLRIFVVEGRDEDFARWLDVGPPELVARWEERFQQAIVPAVARRVGTSPAALRVVSVLREHVPKHRIMRRRREVLLELLPRLSEETRRERLLADVGAVREHARVQGGGTAKDWGTTGAYEAFRDAAGKLRETVDEVEGLLTFDASAALEAAQVGRQLLAVAAGVRRRYIERKRELAALDFDDLLAHARNVLLDPRNEELRRGLAAHTHLLLVDEFQDTDRVQVELVKALCDETVGAGRLFFVGDYKQSIYRFRGADPHVFRRLRGETPAAGRLSLTMNFRSQPAILEFVNALFWDDLGPDYEPLRAHRRQTTSVPAIEFLWAPLPDNANKADVRALRRREARWIARRIGAMLEGQEPLVSQADDSRGLKEGARPAMPGDIAILFRALSDVELYEEELQRLGIGYYLVGGHAFYAQQEIFDLLNLLRAIASPSDAVSLAGVLRSGFFALADETLFWLAQHPDGLAGGLFARQTPSQIAAEQQPRVAFAAATLARLRREKDRLRVCELVELAMSLSGYDATILAEFLGDRKLANLRKVIEQARGFERGASFGLAEFIGELAQFVARQPKEPLAATFSEDMNVVRLMTVHQAKGLEFPIVIVPDADRPAEQRTARAHLDAELGPLVKLPDDADGHATGGYELWRFGEQDEELAELHRLFYVATTRAADYLILSSGVAQVGGAKGPWMQLVARRFDPASGRLIGPLPLDEPRPQIKVTTVEPHVAARPQARGGKTDWAKLIAQVRHEAAEGTGPREMPGIPPIPVDRAQRRLYSFSRLSGALKRRDEPAGDDRGPLDPRIDPLGLGTLVHSVLAAIDFAATDGWRELVEVHAERQLLEHSAEAAEAAGLIERLIASPRAAELSRAKQSMAEVEFLLAWPPEARGEVDPSVVLAGYIDRLYQDVDGRWHVLDFKTNRVTGASLARVAAEYEMQMLVYGLAAERVLGTQPASVALHFLRGGLEHSFAWNDVARRRVVALVDEALAAAMLPPSTGAAAVCTYPSAG
jgi:ATP-dependent helicase/nuclease subunit A